MQHAYSGTMALRGPALNTTVTRGAIFSSKCTSNYLAARLSPVPLVELTAQLNLRGGKMMGRNGGKLSG